MIELKDFPKDLQDKIEKILISNEDVLFYGSTADPHIIFRGDTDLLQTIKRKDSRENIMNEIKDLISKILKIRDGSYYISEIKMGENEKVREEVEQLLKNKKKINKKKINELLDRMKLEGHEINKIKSTLNKRMTEENYYNLEDEMRDLYVYRWTAEEILNGDADFTIKNNELICKYDVQIFTGFRYYEMSNYIIFPNLIEKKEEDDEEFLKSLRKNIMRQYYSDKNYFKTAKRLLTYYKQKDNEEMQEKIYELINNPILGNLYIIKSGLGVLETIMTYNKKKIDKEKIKLNIESFKMNTIYFDEEERNKINKKLDKIYNSPTLKKIEQLKTEINRKLQKETLKYSKEIGFNMTQVIKSFVQK